MNSEEFRCALFESALLEGVLRARLHLVKVRLMQAAPIQPTRGISISRSFPPAAFPRWSLELVLLLVFACHGAAESEWSNAISQWRKAIQAEVDAGHVSGVSVAMVHDQKLVYADGFGFADKKRGRTTTAGTVYRAGSISKLFTALAAMQWVERGQIDIDQPARRYVPEFAVVNPFEQGGDVTLRQLMCHRSGMVRESPVGSYFDPTEPSVADTVASLAGCALVYPPNTKTKYSNSGVTVVGRAVALVADESYEDYQARHLLAPIGMNDSSFRLNRTLKKRLAKGYLPVADGRGGFREIESPHFELGTIPAGNLYTTARDLGRFLSFLFAEGWIGDRQLIQHATLQEMFTPQLTDQAVGFGLGFNMGEFRGLKTFSHSGAVYGFTSIMIGIPSHKLGVVVLINDDIAIGPMRKLSELGLNLMLEADQGLPFPETKPTAELASDLMAALVGDYESESFWGEIRLNDGTLEANIGGQRLQLRAVGDLTFEGSGRIAEQTPFEFNRAESGSVQGFSAFGRSFQRIDPDQIPDTPLHWQELLGSYGPKFIPLIVSIRHGHLYAMTENEFDNRLTPVTRHVFKMPRGLYTDEYLVFQADAKGRLRGATLANMPLPKH